MDTETFAVVVLAGLAVAGVAYLVGRSHEWARERRRRAADAECGMLLVGRLGRSEAERDRLARELAEAVTPPAGYWRRVRERSR